MRGSIHVLLKGQKTVSSDAMGQELHIDHTVSPYTDSGQNEIPCNLYGHVSP